MNKLSFYKSKNLFRTLILFFYDANRKYVLKIIDFSSLIIIILTLEPNTLCFIQIPGIPAVSIQRFPRRARVHLASTGTLCYSRIIFFPFKFAIFFIYFSHFFAFDKILCLLFFFILIFVLMNMFVCYFKQFIQISK